MTTDEILARMRVYAARKAAAFLPAAVAEDAAQEALVAVWQALPRLDAGREPWPFLAMIARQEIAMFAREHYARAAREEALAEDAADTFEAAPIVAQEAPLSPRLAAAVASLSERQEVVVRVTILDGRTDVAAASLLGVSKNAVGQTKRRAVEALREHLAAA